MIASLEAQLQEEQHAHQQTLCDLSAYKDQNYKLKQSLKSQNEKTKKQIQLFAEQRRQHKLIEVKTRENESLRAQIHEASQKLLQMNKVKE